MDADRLPSFDRYELDLANERLLHDGEAVLLTLDADLPHTVPSRYETAPLTERNAPRYRLEEARSALGVKTLKTLRQVRPAKLKPHGFRRHEPARGADPPRRVQRAVVRRAPKAGPADPATRPLPHQAHVLLAHRVVGATSTARQAGEADG